MSKDKHHQSFSHVHLFDDKYQLSNGSLACFSGRLCYCQILYNESWVVSDCFCQAIKSFFSSLKQQVKCKLKFQELQNTYSRKRDSTPTPATSLLILNVVFKSSITPCYDNAFQNWNASLVLKYFLCTWTIILNRINT